VVKYVVVAEVVVNVVVPDVEVVVKGLIVVVPEVDVVINGLIVVVPEVAVPVVV